MCIAGTVTVRARRTSRGMRFPVSPLSLAQDIAGKWGQLTGGPPRGVFVCVAEVCGSSMHDGHLMVIKNLDLAKRADGKADIKAFKAIPARPPTPLCCLSTGPAGIKGLGFRVQGLGFTG